MKELSVIISNRNDTAMLSVTINSCIEAFVPIGINKCEIVIADNSDDNIYNQLKHFLPTKYLTQGIIKVFRQSKPGLFTARELAIEKARAQLIICIDSHMIIGHNTFLDLYNFMGQNKENKKIAFAHAPIRWAHQHSDNAKHDRDMSVNELGNWNTYYKVEKKISWKGMPWITTKSIWNNIKGYGSLSKYNISWGGGDMHIGIKPWLLGYENWSVPTRPCIHIGPFPNQTDHKYRLYSASGNYPHAFGFLVSCYVLGGEAMMLRNRDTIIERFGKYINIKEYWNKAKIIGKEEREWLKKKQKITFEQLLENPPWN